MSVHVVRDNGLSVSEGAESPFISCTHLTLDVIEQQREAAAAKLLHLADTNATLEDGSASSITVINVLQVLGAT